MLKELPILNNGPGNANVKWGKVIDNTKCIGCHACSTACKSEHLVPLGVNRTYVKQVEIGVYPEVSRHFQVTRCNQCEDAPCVPVCPVTAMFKRPDGIVDFDKDICIGCKACIAACPYDAIHISPESHSAEKCNFCAHRIDQGLEPACVVICPEEAIIVGDLNDPLSDVSKIVARQKVDVRKPEKGTSPKVFYVGASEATLSPTAAAYTGLHTYAQQKEQYPVEDVPSTLRSVAAARVAYDVPHKAPWDWKVSLYTWTKSVAAGVFLIYFLLAVFGSVPSKALMIANSVIGGIFLAITGLLLILDLKHPSRFYFIFTRPQWKSWLVRGSFIILGYSIVLLLQFIAGLSGSSLLDRILWWPGMILAIFTAIYTAFLFSQSKGRDLWQNPILPLHFFVQAVLAGASVYVLLALFIDIPESGLSIIRYALVAAVGLHLLLILSEAVIPHMTADAARAAHQMIRGRYSRLYWIGVLAGGVVPLLLAIAGWMGMLEIAALLVVAGLLAYEHAYVQAGQSVPLS